MRIIVDNGAYTLKNLGDVAMLQVAINRVRAHYPASEILVLTSRPDLLQRHCPGTLPLSSRARDAAFPMREKACSGSRVGNGSRKNVAAEKSPNPCPEGFAEVLAGADMLVVAGGGFLNDLNQEAACAVLQMLEQGVRQGSRVALFSQGLGPLTQPCLVEGLTAICRGGAFVGLREAECGPAILQRAQPHSGRWAVTGDDALELCSHPSRQAKISARDWGGGIGVSVRRAGYSGVTSAHLAEVSAALEHLSKRSKSAVLPIPISFNDFEDDCSTLEAIVRQPVGRLGLETPGALISTAARCRVVLAGTYHAAVFALGQGVPCVCFHGSTYYRDKMCGLAAQFGRGCAVMDLNRGVSADQIAQAAAELWERAPDLREELLLRAQEQVARAREFYRTALTQELATAGSEALRF